MEDKPRDVYDRVIGSIDGIPGSRKSKPSTVTSVEPMLGDAQTYVVQTYSTEEGNFGFVQMIDRQGGQRFVLPPKAMAAIYRQRDALVKAGRVRRAKDRWENLSPEEREANVARLRAHRPTRRKAG